MTSVFSRLKDIITMKMNKALDSLEDPRDKLDYIYYKQLQYLRQLEEGLVNVTTAKKRLEYQLNDINERAKGLEAAAKEALKQGKEDLAKKAIERKIVLEAHAEALKKNIAELDEQIKRLTQVRDELRTKIEKFRAEKELLKAQYSAALARTKVNEYVTGLANDGENVGLAMERTKERITELTARADAIDELIATGGLSTGTEEEKVQQELDDLKMKAKIDEELNKIKEEVGKQP